MPETKAQAETAPAAPEPPRKKYRLLARAFMDGGLREVGHIFTLAEGELGPHKTVSHGPDIVHQEADRDADREVGKAKDIPLYEEVREEPELPIEERQERELKEFEERVEAEYHSLRAKHQEELSAAKESAAAHAAENPQPAIGADEGREPDTSAVAMPPANPSDEPDRARSIADADWATRPEHGASAADANWPGAKAEQIGRQPVNRPYMQSGPGHDPNVPS